MLRWTFGILLPEWNLESQLKLFGQLSVLADFVPVNSPATREGIEIDAVEEIEGFV